MKIFVALKEKFGINDYIGCYPTETKAALAEKGCKVLPESLETEKMVDNEIFIASTYAPETDMHGFVGVYYSLDDAIEAAGNKGLVHSHSVDLIFKAA
jgi:hypothetical protein